MIDVLLVIHVVFGGVALVSGAMAMIVKKGKKPHIFSGRTFALSMFVVAATAIYISVAKNISFLLLVGLFSVFMVASAWRSLYHIRHKEKLSKNVDYLILAVGFGSGIFMIYNGVVGLLAGSSFSIVSLVFGVINILLSYGHMRRLGPDTPPKEWLRSHIAGMGGAYIATSTAFLVVNVSFQPSWVLWLLPTVIGSFLISRSIRKWILR